MPGLYKIFDEIIVNASDNKQRDSSMDALKVEINQVEPEKCGFSFPHALQVRINIYLISTRLIPSCSPKTNVKSSLVLPYIINQELGTLSVWNNGAGIPVVVHKEHGIYVPELIFGNLLTGM